MRNLARKLVLYPLLFVWLLTGCGQVSPTVIEVPRVAVPPELLTCRAQPIPPDVDADDVAIGDWIVDAMGAGQDCRDRLANVARVVAP